MVTVSSARWVTTFALVFMALSSGTSCWNSSGEASGAKLKIEEFKALTAEAGGVVVDFGATWCGPCRAMKPVFKKLAKEYEGRTRFLEVDVDANPELTAQFKVSSIPTFIIFRSEEIVDKRIGSMSEQDFRAWLGKHLR